MRKGEKAMRRYPVLFAITCLVLAVLVADASHAQSTGGIIAWGSNGYGQCDVPAPNEDFLAIFGGQYHSLGLKSDGTIMAWGYNIYGQCDVPAPNEGFVAVASGSNHSLGLKSDSTIVAWGSNNDGQCDVPAPNEDFVAVASGLSHSLGLKSDGTIVAWGYNGYGQCFVPAPNEDFVAVAGGWFHCLGLKSDSTIVAWGRNSESQCFVPAPNDGFVAVAGGRYHSLGLSEAVICDVSPTSIDFSTVFVDAYKDTTFVIRNIGYGTLTGSVGETCDYFSILSGGGAYSIDPGDSLIVTVRFEPVFEGVDTCIVDTGTECGPVLIWGIGQGPLCSVAPLEFDFGFVTIDQHEDLDFSVTNTGGGRLTGSVAETCEYFSIVSGEGAYDLGHNDSLFVTVHFEPLTTDAAICSISTGGSCGEVVCMGTGDRAPHIYAVRDVPGDQGGFINVAWDASPGDNSTEHLITRYTAWRAIDPTAAELSSIAPGFFITRISDLSSTAEPGIVRIAIAGSATYYWKLISSIDAYYLEGYSEVVPTLFDWTDVCDEYHYVQIIAHTSDPYTFWASHPDSGRSVDNLAPDAPLGLAGEQSYSPAGLNLSWAPNSESDLGGYAIYRGESADFIPASGNLVTSTPDTLYLDTEWSWDSGYYYKVSALDIHGNESNFALFRPDEATGDDTPQTPEASYLAQNYPNPFNPLTQIVFGLAEPAHVSLRVYNAAGHLVRVLVDEELSAARYEENWDGRDGAGRQVSSGLYFYRLEAGSFIETRKMVLLR